MTTPERTGTRIRLKRLGTMLFLAGIALFVADLCGFRNNDFAKARFAFVGCLIGGLL